MRAMQFLLFPFTLLYALITHIRNVLYDLGIKKTIHFDTPFLISVGNLTVGGTGKTPHVEYLVRLLKDQKIAILSRGYGRKTKGTLLAKADSTPEQIGDEPAQYNAKFGSKVPICVSENRVKGVQAIMKAHPDTEIVIMDDAFQHRKIGRHLNVLLSDYHRPFYTDWVLPAGRLRESRKGASRADAVIVTKCPHQLDEKEQQNIAKSIATYTKAPVFFSAVVYDTPVFMSGKNMLTDEIVLVTGIVKATALQKHLAATHTIVKHYNFPDHHEYRQSEVDEWKKQYAENTILTTEKDAVKLRQLNLEGLTIVYLPIKVELIGAEFDSFVLSTQHAH